MQSPSAHEQFWQWFQSNGTRLQAMMYGQDDDARDDASEELREAVQAVEPGLILEMGQGGEGEPDQLVVSADGKPDRVDAVKDFVASAPTLPGWTVIAFRPRMEIGESVEIAIQDERIGPDDIWFEIEEDQHGLNVMLYVRGLTAANKKMRGLGASLLAEHAMGEADALTLLNSLQTEPLPKNPTAAGLRPFWELVAVIDEVREKKYPPPGSLPIDSEAGWQAGRGTISGSAVVLLLHADLQSVAGHPSYDNRLTVSIHCNEINDDGMPATEDEYHAVSELGDQIREVLETDQESLLAMTLTTQGRRDLVFYTSNAQAAQKRLEPWQTGKQVYRVKFSVERDTYWGMFWSFCQAASESDDESEDEDESEE
jgi:hypothetical protein